MEDEDAKAAIAISVSNIYIFNIYVKDIYLFSLTYISIFIFFLLYENTSK